MMNDMDWVGNNRKAIAPLRVSSYGQEDNTSRITQERDIRAYCQEMGLQLVEVIPIVETARKSDLRKKYTAALNKALKQGTRHIIFHKYDREARNLTDNENNEYLVREGRIVLHYVSDGKILHKCSPDSEFLNRDIHAAINKHYSRDLSTKVRKATHTKAGTGWYPGTHPPLGYMNQKLKSEKGHDRRRGSIIVPDPNPRIVKQVQREFELRASKPPMSALQIRKKIIEENLIPLGEIKNYHVGTIDRRLRNIFYDGRFIWQGVEYQGKHEKIIPREIFWKVQATFGVKNPYHRNDDALFGNGWMKCGHPECGCNIIYDPIKKTIKATGESKIFKYYHCTNGKKIHESLQGMRTTEEKLMEQFEPAVKQISIREDFRDELLVALTQTQDKTRKAMKRDMESFEVALASLHERENRAYDRWDSGEISKETYNQQRMRLQEDQLHYAGLMKQTQLAINDVSNECVKSILQLATNAESLWKRRSSQERRELLNELLSNPVLDGLTVRYEIIKPLRTLSEMKTDERWRRERDSNSRGDFSPAPLARVCLRPLGHLSARYPESDGSS